MALVRYWCSTNFASQISSATVRSPWEKPRSTIALKRSIFVGMVITPFLASVTATAIPAVTIPNLRRVMLIAAVVIRFPEIVREIRQKRLYILVIRWEKNVVPVADEAARRQASESAAFADEVGLIEVAQFVDNAGPRLTPIIATGDQRSVKPDRLANSFGVMPTCVANRR